MDASSSLRKAARAIYRAALARLSERNRIRAAFLRGHRRLPDLDNPKTFSELVQWRKLNGLATDPRFSIYADKVKVKEIVASTLGPEWITPTLWSGKTLPDALDWPMPFVIKANHAAGRNHFVRTPADRDAPDLQVLTQCWLADTHYPHLLETHYDRIDPQLLVEPIIGADGVSPDDFKLFVFGGRVEFIQVDLGRFSAHRRVFYDRDWRRCAFGYEYPLYEGDVPRPGSLERMIEGAEVLARGFDFVRLDFYDLDGEPRFGEATFAPESGFGRFRPAAMDAAVGALWLPHLQPPPQTAEPPIIALYIADLKGGGAERVCLILADHLVRRGYRVDLVVCRAAGPLMTDIPAGVRLVAFDASSSLASLGPLARYLKQSQPAAMLAHLVPQNTMAVLAARLSGATTRVFVTQHAALSAEARVGWSPWRRLAPMLYRWILPRATGVVAVSQGVARDLAAVIGFPAARITAIYNPVEIDALIEQSCKSLDLALAHPDGPLILGVGRLTEQKRFDVLIDAFALLAAERACNLVVCGEGPLRKALKVQIARLGLEERIKLVGFQSNPARFMAAADLVVLCSAREGFGNVLVEAMACGTPVVATDCPHGPAEILDGGRFGELTPVGDAPALAAAMKRTLDNPLPKETLVGRARDFSAEKAVDRYLDLFGLPRFAPGAEPSA